MQLQIIDNIQLSTAAILTSAIKTAKDVRIAVAFVSSDGLSKIMPSVQTALAAGAYIEFLVGMDVRATDPLALRELFTLSSNTPNVSLLCFAPKSASGIYHPKMYLMKDNHNVTAIIGSSNLTRHGLVSNIEANVVIRDVVQTEIISEIYSTYNKLKYHRDRVVPDSEFIELFTEICKKYRSLDLKLSRDYELKKLKETFFAKANRLQRPKPTQRDLVGWLKLVYDALPDGEFTNQDIYKFENKFRELYPKNLNIRAKIRQQLQILNKLGFIRHVKPRIWEKIS